MVYVCSWPLVMYTLAGLAPVPYTNPPMSGCPLLPEVLTSEVAEVMVISAWFPEPYALSLSGNSPSDGYLLSLLGFCVVDISWFSSSTAKSRVSTIF